MRQTIKKLKQTCPASDPRVIKASTEVNKDRTVQPCSVETVITDIYGGFRDILVFNGYPECPYPLSQGRLLSHIGAGREDVENAKYTEKTATKRILTKMCRCTRHSESVIFVYINNLPRAVPALGSDRFATPFFNKVAI